jgi:cyclase
MVKVLKIRLIPCLDVKNGRIVKGVNFVNLTDAGDPVAVAKKYDLDGADELFFLDISATQENRTTMYDLITRTAENCFMPLTVGGGVRSLSDVKNLLMAGADKVSFNSEAIVNPDIISDSANKFGNQCIVVAIDAKKVTNGFFEIFTHGGTRPTGINAIEFAMEMERKGAGEILLTSMDNDGTRKGYNTVLTKTVATSVKIPVIASGGVGDLQHLVDGVKKGHASAVLAASIFHFGEYSIKEAKEYMQYSGIPVRLE